MVLREEDSQSRIEGFSHAIQQRPEAGEVLVWFVPLEEEGRTEEPLSMTAGEGDLPIAASSLCWARG